MEMITQVTENASAELAKKWDDIVLARLKEAGYDIVNLEQIARRCTVMCKEKSNVRELWVDYGRDNAQLVATYTDPKVELKKNGNTFEATMSFTFTPLPTSQSATVGTNTTN